MKKIRLVLFSPARNLVSETFIKAHIERLPFDVIPLYGTDLGIEDADGRKISFCGFYLSLVVRLIFPSLYHGIRNFFLARYLRLIKAEAVLAEYGTTGSYLTPACQKVKVPLFVHFHGFDASVYDVLAREQNGYQKMFKASAGVVAVSKAMKKSLLSLGADSNRLYLNHYGVDPELFKGAEPAKSKPEFLAVGRLVEKKAPYLTILAFSRVLRVVPSAQLNIVGTGPLLGPCERMVQALHLEKAVNLLGICGSDRVSCLMRQSRAFVQHSLIADSGDSEGTPVAIIEAQMSGLPVVGTQHAGIPDVVLDGETGFIVEEADIDAMAEAMICLAEDCELAGRLGKSARERAIKFFSMDRHINQLAEMIQDSVYQHARVVSPSDSECSVGFT